MIFFANINNFYFKDTFSIGNEKKLPLPKKNMVAIRTALLNQDSLLKKAVFNYAEQASAFILKAAFELPRSKAPQHARRS